MQIDCDQAPLALPVDTYFASNAGEHVSYEFYVKPTQLFDSDGQVDSRTTTNLISEKLIIDILD